MKLAIQSVYCHINYTQVPFNTEQLRGSIGNSNPEQKKCGVFEILSISLSLTYPFEVMTNLLKKQSLAFWKLILEIEKITAVKVFAQVICNHNVAFKHWL